MDVLDEIELLIACSSPEIVSLVRKLVGMALSVCANDSETASFPKRWIRKNHINRLSLRFEAVRNRDHRMFLVRTDSVEKKVHGAQARDIGDKINPVQGSRPKVCSLLGI